MRFPEEEGGCPSGNNHSHAPVPNTEAGNRGLYESGVSFTTNAGRKSGADDYHVLPDANSLHNTAVANDVSPDKRMVTTGKGLLPASSTLCEF